MTHWADPYILAERTHFSAETPIVEFPRSIKCEMCFAANDTPQELIKRIISVLEPINLHIAHWNPEVGQDQGKLETVDANWRLVFPDWFSTKFATLPTEALDHNPFEGLSEQKITKALREFPKTTDTIPVLTGWLLNYRLNERYWFYEGYEIRSNILVLQIRLFDGPEQIYALEDLVERCGGTKLETEKNLGKLAKLRKIFGG